MNCDTPALILGLFTRIAWGFELHSEQAGVVSMKLSTILRIEICFSDNPALVPVNITLGLLYIYSTRLAVPHSVG